MLDFEKTLELFLLFSDLEAEVGERWGKLCSVAMRRVEARLRPGVDLDEEGNRELLHAAAAAWAYCDYLMAASAGGSEELRVGDISVKTGATSRSDRQDAVEIREHFLGQAAHLLLPPCPALLLAGGEA